MKRIKAERLEQTLHFMLKDGLGPEAARQQVGQEYEHYKTQMDSRGTKYKILQETEQPGGPLLIQVKRQNDFHPVGSCLD